MTVLARSIDFETTGLPPDAAVCEVGYSDIRVFDYARPPEVSAPVSMLVNPGRPMPPEGQAIHHIGDFDVCDAPPIVKGFMQLTTGSPDVFVAHNAQFEREFFTGGEVPWICTRKVAMRLWPTSPNFQNQTLRYFLGVPADDRLASPPHRAGPDAYVTALIFAEALKLASIEQMIEWTSNPALLPGPINFGKYKGTPWPDVISRDRQYVDWIVNKSDMDADTKFTARHHLRGR